MKYLDILIRLQAHKFAKRRQKGFHLITVFTFFGRTTSMELWHFVSSWVLLQTVYAWWPRCCHRHTLTTRPPSPLSPNPSSKKIPTRSSRSLGLARYRKCRWWCFRYRWPSWPWDRCSGPCCCDAGWYWNRIWWGEVTYCPLPVWRSAVREFESRNSWCFGRCWFLKIKFLSF